MQVLLAELMRNFHFEALNEQEPYRFNGPIMSPSKASSYDLTMRASRLIPFRLVTGGSFGLPLRVSVVER